MSLQTAVIIARLCVLAAGTANAVYLRCPLLAPLVQLVG